MRTATITRKTAETDISVELSLDGSGSYDNATGVGFFDHMLDQLARHAMLDLTVRAEGDLHIDDHHTVEDTGIAIGQALAQALGDKRGIRRYGECSLPMDDTLVRAALDLSGRPWLGWGVAMTAPRIGSFDTELVREFFQALSTHGGITLHVDLVRGVNSHHIAEAAFKAVARALRMAVEPDPRAERRAALDQGHALTVTTVLIDYESGNLHSAEKAFQRMARETGGGEVIVSARPEDVARADRIVLPGDGAFPSCMAALRDRSGLHDALVEAVEARGRPFLGICVGMQLMSRMGHEYTATPGFGWIDGEVRRIAAPGLKVPHMGWNDLVIDRPHPVLDGIATGDHAYFVHSYQIEMDDPEQRLAHCDYGGDVTAIVASGTRVGTQFHPEKSQAAGLRLIANFLRWRP